jgi:hypothetical protein
LSTLHSTTALLSPQSYFVPTPAEKWVGQNVKKIKFHSLQIA